MCNVSAFLMKSLASGGGIDIIYTCLFLGLKQSYHHVDFEF